MHCYMLSDYLKEQYGTKIYKLLLSGGMTCPNRDGKCGVGGCIFCSRGGSGEFSQDSRLTIDEQIEREKEKLKDKSKSDKYIAYFQSFSNTYAPVEYLRELYTPVVMRDDVAVLSIATRPDCLSDEIIDLLIELNKIKPVWVELGLQTKSEKTAEFINRGYKNEVYEIAVEKLRRAKINVITHLILGLPYETKEDMIASARYAGLHSDGIKFHLLYVVKDTILANLYEKGEFELITMDEYIDILCDCIRSIPAEVVIHRLTGDPDKSSLIAPLWSADKVKVLREIHNALYDKNAIQGEFLNI
ncbi:MAG: TIGR01212 family radical SAM protein [Ruminococcaceae bacterium]|nr:TIGR01212 family radical SAM protein [Oscillospiraceae bacterium]